MRVGCRGFSRHEPRGSTDSGARARAPVLSTRSGSRCPEGELVRDVGRRVEIAGQAGTQDHAYLASRAQVGRNCGPNAKRNGTCGEDCDCIRARPVSIGGNRAAGGLGVLHQRPTTPPARAWANARSARAAGRDASGRASSVRGSLCCCTQHVVRMLRPGRGRQGQDRLDHPCRGDTANHVAVELFRPAASRCGRGECGGQAGLALRGGVQGNDGGPAHRRPISRARRITSRATRIAVRIVAHQGVRA